MRNRFFNLYSITFIGLCWWPLAVALAQDAENPALAQRDATQLQDTLIGKGAEFVEDLAKPIEEVIHHDEAEFGAKPPPPTATPQPYPSDDSDAAIEADINALEGTPLPPGFD